MDLTQPLSADPALLQYVAELALHSNVYAIAWVLGVGVSLTCMTFTGRSPSIKAIGGAIQHSCYALLGLLVVSATTALPWGIAILVSGCIATFAASMAGIAVVNAAVDELGEAIGRGRADCGRRFVPPPIAALFTLRTIRLKAFLSGLALVLFGAWTGVLPFVLIGGALGCAGLQTRSRYWAYARKSYRRAWTKRRAALTATNHP